MVRALEAKSTTHGVELFAPDYRSKLVYPGGERDYIDTAERPDPEDALANAIYDMYGFKHRGETYRFDIEASSGNWVKFYIVDADGNYVATVERSISEYGSMSNERFFMADEFQNQGIGTKFLDTFEGMAMEQLGVDNISLEAAAEGRYAWASHGYEKVGGYDRQAENWIAEMRDYLYDQPDKMSTARRDRRLVGQLRRRGVPR